MIESDRSVKMLVSLRLAREELAMVLDELADCMATSPLTLHR